MPYLVLLLILVSSFSSAIFAARRIPNVAVAYPVGIVMGSAVLAIGYLVIIATASYSLLAAPGLPFPPSGEN